MPYNFEKLHQIATETRRDFLDKKISALLLAQVLRIHRPEVVAGESEVVTLSCVVRAIETFPGNSCDSASAELRRRIRYGEIVVGCYGKDDGGYYDEAKKRWVAGLMECGDRYHSFLDVGETDVARSTIVDITADQFGGPAVYVGDLHEPWSRWGNYNCV